MEMFSNCQCKTFEYFKNLQAFFYQIFFEIVIVRREERYRPECWTFACNVKIGHLSKECRICNHLLICCYLGDSVPYS